MENLSTELRYLLYVVLLGLLIWVPYILAEIAQNGLVAALGYPDERKRPLWAQRLARAHYNLLENTVPFAIVVLAGEMLRVHTSLTAACAMIFFWARLAHPVAQVTRIWGTRTLAFAAGHAATLVYLLALLLR
ncbi:MAG: MAPEG family protein [Pseudomonadota bacterium]|nr:MAPEG family protein [Pseudomonadota bacterium]